MVRALRALALPAGPALWSALREAWEGGPALLPLNPALPPRERDRLLAELRPGGEPVEDDVVAVVATSGSTGAARGVELTRTALEHSARASLARLGATRDERWLCCLPPSSVGGLGVLVRSLVLGTEPVLHERFDVAAVAGADAQAVSLVPTMLARLLDADVDLTRFRHVLLGGDATAPALRRAARVTATYGMTETCGGCVYDGRPLEGVEVELDGEIGRIRLRGPMLARGYRFGRPLPLVDGWLETSDLGRRTAEGRLEVLGRADDVIVSGGVKVVPFRVEAALAEHPGVREVAVVGRPDREWGARVVAVVVPADGVPPDLGALRSFLADRLAPAELPRELVLTGHLPLLPTGKLDRRSLTATAT
jgi:o-succinylbenzoate---CoA ligase